MTGCGRPRASRRRRATIGRRIACQSQEIHGQDKVDVSDGLLLPASNSLHASIEPLYDIDLTKEE